MKGIKRVWLILKRTGAYKILINFFIMCIISSFILKLTEPNIKNIGDGIWYTFVASTTIGFGDIYATTLIGRIITIFVSFNGILVFAAISGVVVSYYSEYLSDRKNESISLFMEKLENLPNLSKEELVEISEKVKKLK